MLSDTQKKWKTACRKELESFHRHNVFELVNPPKDRKIIRNRWVFDLKSNGHKKARLVAKGFSQIEGVDYDEIFLPVVRFETVWMMIALAALKKWHIQELDIKTTFLYEELDEELYIVTKLVL
jgi:Reverse transcriptase (RNA-dependent DNA polymerase)